MEFCERIYERQINKNPMISSDKHLELLRRWKKEGDQKSFELLYGSIIKFVPKIASTLRAKNHSSYMDLIQEGNIAVYNALLSFDVDNYSNSVFSYCLRLVKKYMITYLSKKEDNVPVKNNRYKKLAVKNPGLNSSDLSDLAKKNGFDEELFSDVYQKVHNKSLRTDVDKAEQSKNQEEVLETKDIANKIMNQINNIQDARRKDMVLDSLLKEKTYLQIGNKYGVSKQRAFEVVKKEVEKIRESIEL